MRDNPNNPTDSLQSRLHRFDSGRRLSVREPHHSPERLIGSGPVLGQDVWATRAKRIAKRHRGDDHVIELSDDGDEVGHQIDRNREIDDERDEGELSATRNPLVADQATQQHEAVGNEAGERTSLHPPIGGKQGRDQGEVEKKGDACAEEQPFNG